MANYNYGLNIESGKLVYKDTDGTTVSAPDAAAVPGIEMIAAAYSKKTYAVGDYCTKDGKFYVCKTAITGSGENWTAAHWTETTVGAALAGKANKT